MQDFLHNKAITFEKRDISRTYLMMDGQGTPAPGIAGYFTIALTVLNLPDDKGLSSTVVRRMNLSNNRAPAYLIGQISKRDSMERGVGLKVMNVALDVIKSGHETFGGRIVCIDCRQPLIDYYEKLGFKKIGHPSDSGLYKSVLLLS
ncbi:MAG: hypothetical protein GX224_04440 [Thermoplasmatales archaeon]|nr:hypothetical protein [Thermoplasmatales archaeon]